MVPSANLASRRRPAGAAVVAALAAALLLLALAHPLRAQERPDLVIFHTNDVHGYALPQWDEGGRLTTVGYPIFKGYVDSVDAGAKMLLDAGDLLSGQPFANARHGLMPARMLGLVKYDALAAGNHDFDFGVSRLMELSDRYELNFIAANIRKKEDGSALFPSYILKDYGGLKVGVFGLSSPDTPLKTHPDNVVSLDFGGRAEIESAARELVAGLRGEGAGLIIALTHLGTDPKERYSARDLARAVPGIDLIIDGHSHSEIAGLKEGGALIVSTGAHFQNIGRVDVSRDTRGGLVLSPRLIPAEEAGLQAPNPELDALGATLTIELDRELDQVVTTLPFALEGDEKIGRLFSTNLGRLVCAALKRATGADAALINSGSIRAGLPAGEVTRRQLLKVLPFGNQALTVRLKGEQIIEAVNIGLNQPGEGGFPQFYGLTVTAIELKNTPASQPSPENENDAEEKPPTAGRVDIIEIGGRPLDKDAEYTLAITDFLHAGGDGYQLFTNLPAQQYAPVEEIFLKYLSETSRETLDFINLDDVLTVLVEE